MDPIYSTDLLILDTKEFIECLNTTTPTEVDIITTHIPNAKTKLLKIIFIISRPVPKTSPIEAR